MTAFSLEVKVGDDVTHVDQPLFLIARGGAVPIPTYAVVEVEAHVTAGRVRLRAEYGTTGSLDGAALQAGVWTDWAEGATLELPGVPPIRYAVQTSTAGTRSLHGLTRCPRCRGALVPTGGATGPAYRGAPVYARTCAACAASIVAPDAVSGLSVLDGPARRNDAPVPGSGCETCHVQLRCITLSWGPHTVLIEQCPVCAVLVLDAGERARLLAVGAALRETRAAPARATPTGRAAAAPVPAPIALSDEELLEAMREPAPGAGGFLWRLVGLFVGR
jgi:Zn-finger nucleic acid-binding protein